MTTPGDKVLAGSSDNTMPITARRELIEGLLTLWRAFNYSQDARVDRWQFATEIQQFYDLGLTNNELRWLVAKGFVAHGREMSTGGDTCRSFQYTDGLTFFDDSALVLTETGTDFAAQFDASNVETVQIAPSPAPRQQKKFFDRPRNGKDKIPGKALLKPSWDARRRELRIGGELVKWYRVPATSQEAVLAAFEEESWPDFIDDPLPCVTDGDPKQRLHNAIKRLNDHQTNRLIRFYGNGNGEGVGWELIASEGLLEKVRRSNSIDKHPTGSRKKFL